MSLLLLLCTALAAPPVLTLPVAGERGTDWELMALYDHDPAEGRRDAFGGGWTTQDHDGLDLRVRGVPGMMGEGVAVVAPAAGRVLRVRDGEPDHCQGDPVGAFVDGKACGNAVVLDLGDGWEAQLCHLRKGSVAVQPGQEVSQGERLGLVGWSGLASLPHVHLTVRRGGRTVDPLIGAVPLQPRSLWSPEAQEVLSDRTPRLWGSGLDTEATVTSAAWRPDGWSRLPADVDWRAFAVVTGGRPGLRVTMALEGPGGLTRRSDQVADRAYVQFRPWWTLRRPEGGWPEGAYRVRFVVWEGSEVLAERVQEVGVEAGGVVEEVGRPEGCGVE